MKFELRSAASQSHKVEVSESENHVIVKWRSNTDATIMEAAATEIATNGSSNPLFVLRSPDDSEEAFLVQLSITLFLTGCKPEEVVPQEEPLPGSIAEQLTALQSAIDPDTGMPYVRIVAGRPEWELEFSKMRQAHRGQKIGCVFCGAPAIAAALKAACEQHSHPEEGTIFKLHKENF